MLEVELLEIGPGEHGIHDTLTGFTMFYVVEGELTLSCNLKGYFHILPKIQKSYLKNKINKTNEGKMTKNNNFNPPPHTHIHTDTNTWVGGWAGMGGC